MIKAPHSSKSTRIDLNGLVSIVPCPVRHWIEFMPAALRSGAKLITKEPFDLIQVQEPFVCGIAGALLSRCFRLPLVVGLYGDEIDNPAWLAESTVNRLINKVGKWVLSQAAAVRSDSMAVVNKLSRYQIKNLTYIPFLITNAQKFLNPDKKAKKKRNDLLKGSPGPLLLSVSRLEKEKNISLMLSAFARALESHPGLVLAIVGDGSLAETHRKESEYRTQGRVRWLGSIANVHMSTYYQAANLMLLSSNRESAARVLYESLLAGTPVLSTDTAGAREVITDGITGRIVPVGDLDGFSKALSELCSSIPKLKEMGNRGRQLLSSKVTAEAVTEQMKSLYHKALGKAG